MENTMMNVHICSTRKTDKPLMLNVFKAYKLNQGFVPCEPDEADQTYLVSYSRSNICSWLTVSGTHWHDDSFEAEVDPLGLAREFRMPTLRLYLESNGSALIQLCDPSAHSAGIRIIGDSDPQHYNFISDYYKTHEKSDYWEEFLQIFSNVDSHTVFQNIPHQTEDTASALAKLFHIKKEKLCADALHGDQQADAVRLHFKKSLEAEKKLTVKAAFKKIYGDALKPLGFQFAKIKEPCFIRVINNELIQIIGIRDMRPGFIVPFGGIATLYRADLCINTTYNYMSSWLPDVSQFRDVDSGEDTDPRIIAKFNYLLSSPYSVQYTMQSALESVQKWILPKLDPIRSLKDFSTFCKNMRSLHLGFSPIPLRRGYSDSVICYLLDNPVSDAEERIRKAEEKQQSEFLQHPELYPPEKIKWLSVNCDAFFVACFSAISTVTAVNRTFIQ